MVDLKDINCLVYDYGNYFPVAERLSRDDGFGMVYYYCPKTINGFPDHKPLDIGRNVDNVVRVKEWAECIHSVDLIVFPDSHEPELMIFFEGLGKRVFGCRRANELEHNKGLLLDTTKDLGLPVGIYYKIKGLDELDNFLKGIKNVYIKSELRGDMETWKHKRYELSYGEILRMKNNMGTFKNEENYIVVDPVKSIAEIGIDTFCIDGKYPHSVFTGCEIKDTGFVGQIVEYNSLPIQLKDVTDKYSDIFSALNYRGAYSNEVIISDDKRGYLIDKTCFSEDTEILTDKGWKYFYELDGTEYVCTLNPANRNIEYHKPTNYISYHYKGDMILFTNGDNSINSLVTPNHSVWRTDRNNINIFEQRADSITGKGYIPRTGNWIADDIEYFNLPEYSHEWDWNSSRGGGYKICTKKTYKPSLNINMDDWLSFLGFYLTDGGLGGNKNAKGGFNHINISQTKYKSEIRDILKRLPFEFTEIDNRNDNVCFQICDVQLSQYLSQFGGKKDRYVPEYIKQASKRQINIFLDSYKLGDGSPNGSMFTISKIMCDDLQELCLKAGKVCNWVLKKNIGTVAIIKDKEYTRKENIYILREYQKRTDYWFETGCRKDRYIKEVPYDGIVYDVTVKNHIIYVRRNGKPLFSGNCRFPQPPSDLYMELYTNFPQIIWQVACGIVPNIEYKYKWGVQLIIKSELGKTDPSPLIVPEEYRQYVKIKNLVIDDDGTWYYTPIGDIAMSEIGSCIGFGATMKEAINMAKKVADSIQGFDIQINSDCLGKAQEQIVNLKKVGINYLT